LQRFFLGIIWDSFGYAKRDQLEDKPKKSEDTTCNGCGSYDVAQHRNGKTRYPENVKRFHNTQRFLSGSQIHQASFFGSLSGEN